LGSRLKTGHAENGETGNNDRTIFREIVTFVYARVTERTGFLWLRGMAIRANVVNPMGLRRNVSTMNRHEVTKANGRRPPARQSSSIGAPRRILGRTAPNAKVDMFAAGVFNGADAIDLGHSNRSAKSTTCSACQPQISPVRAQSGHSQSAFGTADRHHCSRRLAPKPVAKPAPITRPRTAAAGRPRGSGSPLGGCATHTIRGRR
jgi:hypothetical protein